MTDVATLIADMVRAGVDAELIGRTAEAIASREVIAVRDEQADRRRAKDRERKRLRNSAESAEETPSSPKEMSPTPPETQPSPTVPPSPPKGGGFPLAKPDTATEALSIFNRHAALAGWPKARMTEARRPKLTRRVEEAGGLSAWDAALERARGSPFLTGDNRDGWKADLDFFLQQSSFTKLLEGSYDGKRNGNHQRQHRSASGHDNLLTAMDELLGGRRDGGGGSPGSPAYDDAERDAAGIYRIPH